MQMDRRTVPKQESRDLKKIKGKNSHTDKSVSMVRFRENRQLNPQDCAPSSPFGTPSRGKDEAEPYPLMPGTTTFIKNYYHVHRKKKQNRNKFLGRGKSLRASCSGADQLKWLKVEARMAKVTSLPVSYRAAEKVTLRTPK